MDILFVIPCPVHALVELIRDLQNRENINIACVTDHPDVREHLGKVDLFVAEPAEQPGNLYFAPDANGRRFLDVLQNLASNNISPDLVFVPAGKGYGLCVRDFFPNARIAGFLDLFDNDPCLMPDRYEDFHPEEKFFCRLNYAVLRYELELFDSLLCHRENIIPHLPEKSRTRIHTVPAGVDAGFFRPEPVSSTGKYEDASIQNQTIVTLDLRKVKSEQTVSRVFYALSKAAQEVKGIGIYLISDGQDFKFESMDAYSYLIEHTNVTWTDCRTLSSYKSILSASFVHLVMPEYSFGNNSISEAMASECLVIEVRSNSSSKSEDLIKDGKNGLVADITSLENITEKILAALFYPSFMTPLQKKARLSIMEKYPMDHFLKTLSDTIINTGTRPSPRFG